MGTVHSPRSSPGWIGGLLLVVFLAAGMVAQSMLRTRSAEAGETVRADQLALNVAYLADPQRPQLDLTQARLAGVRVASSAPALQRLGQQTEGVMIDQSMLAAVDRGWLVAQQKQGKLIVGINIPFSQLASATNFSSLAPPPPYVEDWSGQALYSLLWRVEQGPRSHDASASDRIVDTTALLGTVRTQLDLLGEARRAVATVEPTPANAPTRPLPAAR